MSAASLRYRLESTSKALAELSEEEDGDATLFNALWAELHGHAEADLIGALAVVECVLTMRKGFIKARGIPAEDFVAQAVAAGEAQNAYAALMEAVVAFEALP